MDKGISMIISIMAIIRAGATYLPLDPEYPLDRIKYMIEHSKTNCIITDSDNYKKFAQKSFASLNIVFIDTIEDEYVDEKIFKLPKLVCRI